MTLHKQSDGKGPAMFSEGEDERLVNRLRDCIEEAENALLDGKRNERNRRLAEADAIFERIQEALRGRFERYARARFPSDKGLQEDAIVEMAATLYEDLMGDAEDSAFYASRFNAAVKILMIDAIRVVRLENGLDRYTGHARLRTVSISQSDACNSDGEEMLALEERISDPAATAVVAVAVGHARAEELLSRLPSAKHRQICLLRAKKMDWNLISQETGIPVRTAQDWYRKCRQILEDTMKTDKQEADNDP